MRRPLGYLWGFVFSLSLAYADPVVLSYEDLLDSWNDQCSTRFQSWNEEPTIETIIYSLAHNPEYSGSGGLQGVEFCLSHGFRAFRPSSATLYQWNTQDGIVPIAFKAIRSSSTNLNVEVPSSPSVCIVNTNRLLNTPERLAPSEYCRFLSSQYWPLPWEYLREGLSEAQNGHLPISLAVLTYEGFSSWALSRWTRRNTLRPSTLDRTLGIQCYQISWNRVRSEWAPGILADLGFQGATNFLSAFPPALQLSWSPVLISDEIHPAPHYPGPLWYMNNNEVNADGSPDYILSSDALSQIQADFDEQGEENPFGNYDFRAYAVFGCDGDSFEPVLGFHLSISAEVKEKNGGVQP